MNTRSIKTLCLALAEYARIESMKAANFARTMNGEALAYSEESFRYSAETLEVLAQEMVD